MWSALGLVTPLWYAIQRDCSGVRNRLVGVWAIGYAYSGSDGLRDLWLDDCLEVVGTGLKLLSLERS